MGNTLFCVSYRFHIFKITRNCECDVTIYGRKIKISKKKLKCMLFDLSEEGLDLAITWLWERFEAERDRWTQASQEIMHTVKKTKL